MPQAQSGATTITYTYDPLYRLTGAEYSSGDSFEYTYDAVGNRLSETACIGVSCTPTTTNYVYDNANRLTSVGGVTYTWDDNGNLLSDGVNTYTYNHTNRLTAFSNPQSAVSFGYNGLGDRLRQTANSVTTNYTLDLNAGLTQALADGTNTYLYGQGRIAQYHDMEKEYFLGDALGSLRQMVNTSGEVTLAKGYEPYGEVLSSTGSGATNYGFTNEYTSQGLIDLRARWYSPQIGRFMSSDTWSGNNAKPMSYNSWLYVYGNPINKVDPSGMIPTLQGIENGEFVYSCHCGWLDFHHANPDLGNELIKMLNTHPKPPRNINIREDALLYQIWIDLPGPFLIGLNRVVKTKLSDEIVKEVALGMYMEREEIRERLQWFAFGKQTYYSEEDLASDLVGFYMAVNKKRDVREKGSDETWGWLAGICGFHKDREEAKNWSRAVYLSYPKFEKIKEWETPRLVCTSDIENYCTSTRKWPSEFKTITPQRPSPAGNWWWYRGLDIDGIFLTSKEKDIYFLFLR